MSGSLTASYATGDVNDGNGFNNNPRGLYVRHPHRGWPGGLYVMWVAVGYMSGTLTASYATGDVNGGDGDEDSVGGLVGWVSDEATLITASYGFGTSTGGEATRIDNVFEGRHHTHETDRRHHEASRRHPCTAA